MNELIVKKINKSGNRIEIEYLIEGEWKRYFNEKEKFFIEYDRQIENVPDSICIIPFIANILPIVWITKASVFLDELDKSFYECIENVKSGYRKMFPKFEFDGSLEVKQLIDNDYLSSGGSALFFSGGLDSFSTLIEHMNEKPQIMTIWGSDIMLNDFEGWKNVKEHIQSVSKDFGVKSNLIKTNFRLFISESNLTNLVFEKAKDGWWHAFQHGIGIISQAAPIAYLDKIGKIYIASSYSEYNKASTCASDPTIDNFVKFAGCNVFHDQYQLTRLQKAQVIVDYAKNTGIYSKLRVCWISSGGVNCCNCEKCYRTIYELIACGENPEKYGMNFNNKINKEAKSFILNPNNILESSIPFWKEIKEMFEKNRDKFEHSEYKWIYKIKFDVKKNDNFQKFMGLARKIKHKLIKIKNKE